MPAGPGESLLTTLFADVHYFFSDPSSKPQHHRFAKGSYVYLYYNAAEKRAKLEIANHAGTPDQDAFSGTLNAANLRYSHKQPNLFTVVIDEAAVQGHDQWHLPSYDEKNEKKYLYLINTLDVYLWTEKDAATFLEHLKSVLPSDRLDIKDAPAQAQQRVEHRNSMSPVVQQLERTAIGSDFPPQRQESVASTHSLPRSPPTASPQPAPLAYNPAAPPAPEPIAHREKTPPPPDADSGTGLGNAPRYDSRPPPQYSNVPNMFGSSSQPASQPSYFTGPPGQYPSATSFPGPPQSSPPGAAQRSNSGSFPPPPPPPGSSHSSQQRTPSFAGPPTQYNQASQPSSPPPNQQNFARQPSFAGPPQPQQPPSFGPHAISSPGLPGPQPQSPPPSAPATYNPAQQPGPPGPHQVFGYSNYNYAAAQQPQGYSQGGGYTGDIHNQAYRPTAEETASHGHKPPPTTAKPKSEGRQQIEERVKGVEAKAGKYLKKLDKLW